MKATVMQANSVRVAWAMAERSLKLIPRVPSTFFPSLIMPIFLVVSFGGQFAGLALLPGFPTDQILNWFIPMATLQGAAFAGITTGLGVARDLENGFFDRFLLSPARRGALVAGPLIGGVLRGFLPLMLLTLVTIFSAATMSGGLLGWVTYYVAALGMALAAGAWAFGLAIRFKTMQVAPLMQTGLFLAVFLSTAQMPLELIGGWLHDVARFNPMTNVLALAREGFLGEVTWADTWPGLVSLAGMAAFLIVFAMRGMRKAIP
jgi:ABC-type multidrug transport system permease subunit